MGIFVLTEAGHPDMDMYFVNPNAPDSTTYAERFTQEAHEAGHPEERLVPLADAVITLATNPDY